MSVTEVVPCARQLTTARGAPEPYGQDDGVCHAKATQGRHKALQGWDTTRLAEACLLRVRLQRIKTLENSGSCKVLCTSARAMHLSIGSFPRQPSSGLTVRAVSETNGNHCAISLVNRSPTDKLLGLLCAMSGHRKLPEVETYLGFAAVQRQQLCQQIISAIDAIKVPEKVCALAAKCCCVGECGKA